MFEGKALRDKLKAGQVCLGMFTLSNDPGISELLSGSGFDFLIIDAEHGALSIESIQTNLMAVKGSDTVAMVRVPSHDHVFIKRVLDAGVGGILIPQVRSAEEVRKGVSACLYPPDGNRGVGPRRPSNYYRDVAEVTRTANRHIVIWAQIEHVDAIADIEQIVRVPRLDGVIPGPSDLAASMGLPGEPGHPAVWDAIQRMKQAAQKAGIAAGMAGGVDAEANSDWLAHGFQFMTLGNLNSLLIAASEGLVEHVRKGSKNESEHGEESSQ